jgi:hypothetical protein
MRWDALFNDLELQLQAVTTAQQERDISERTRSEQSRVTLSQRLSGNVGRQVSVTTRGGRTVEGVLTNTGAGWIVLLSEARSVVVPAASVHVLRGLGRGVGQPLTGVEGRLGLASALRVLSRDRALVSLWVTSPSARYTGRLDRVGSDFVELGLAAEGDDRRAATARDMLTVPFGSIDTVESARVDS